MNLRNLQTHGELTISVTDYGPILKMCLGVDYLIRRARIYYNGSMFLDEGRSQERDIFIHRIEIFLEVPTFLSYILVKVFDKKYFFTQATHAFAKNCQSVALPR